MAKAKQKKKSDSEILFPEVSLDTGIGKINIMPFTLGDLIDLAPNIEAIVEGLKLRGTSLLDDDSNLKFTLDDIFNIYLSSSAEILTILTSVTKVSKEELRKLNPIEAVKLISMVVQQNGDTLKNFFDLFFGEQVVTSEKKKEMLTPDEDEEEENIPPKTS